MGALSDLLKDPAKRRAIVTDGVGVIEAEVGDKRGMTGVAVKAAYGAVKKVKPGFVPSALDHLMPAFADQIDPFYDDYKAKGGGDLRAYFVKNGDAIANALLSITDGRAQKADNRVVRKAYEKLRPQGVQHTVAAMPRLAGLVSKHVG
ncbi:MAG: hypothetical protein H6739_02110 [Alphaproteobacteria bacterium]|nr:hypothetical protein [Alphaproteobacteria bacterium]